MECLADRVPERGCVQIQGLYPSKRTLKGRLRFAAQRTILIHLKLKDTQLHTSNVHYFQTILIVHHNLASKNALQLTAAAFFCPHHSLR